MKWLILLLVLGANFSCVSMKKAQLGIREGLVGGEVIQVGGNEVYCSEGAVCAEVNVLSIAAEPKDGGRVRITLKNRTGNTALVQIRLQIRSAETGEVFTETRAENVAIPASQEKVYEMPGVNKQGAVVRVLLNTAH